jgi:nitrous oxidase accessory protein NosD
VHVAAGSYSGGLNIAKTVLVQGDGSASTFLTGTGTGLGLNITGPSVAVSGLTVRGFDTGLVAAGSTFLALADVGLTGNSVGGGVFNVHTLLFAGGAGDESLYVRPD